MESRGLSATCNFKDAAGCGNALAVFVCSGTACWPPSTAASRGSVWTARWPKATSQWCATAPRDGALVAAFRPPKACLAYEARQVPLT